MLFRPADAVICGEVYQHETWLVGHNCEMESSASEGRRLRDCSSSSCGQGVKPRIPVSFGEATIRSFVDLCSMYHSFPITCDLRGSLCFVLLQEVTVAGQAPAQAEFWHCKRVGWPSVIGDAALFRQATPAPVSFHPRLASTPLLARS